MPWTFFPKFSVYLNFFDVLLETDFGKSFLHATIFVRRGFVLHVCGFCVQRDERQSRKHGMQYCVGTYCWLGSKFKTDVFQWVVCVCHGYGASVHTWYVFKSACYTFKIKVNVCIFMERKNLQKKLFVFYHLPRNHYEEYRVFGECGTHIDKLTTIWQTSLINNIHWEQINFRINGSRRYI